MEGYCDEFDIWRCDRQASLLDGGDLRDPPGADLIIDVNNVQVASQSGNTSVSYNGIGEIARLNGIRDRSPR